MRGGTRTQLCVQYCHNLGWQGMCRVVPCAIYRHWRLIVHLDVYPISSAQVYTLTQIFDAYYFCCQGIRSAGESIDRAKKQLFGILGRRRQQGEAATDTGIRRSEFKKVPIVRGNVDTEGIIDGFFDVLQRRGGWARRHFCSMLPIE